MNAHAQQLQQYFERLGMRERRVLVLGALAALVLVVLLVLLPLQGSVRAASERIQSKRNDLAWLQSVAPQLSMLGTVTPQPLHESLVVLVDRTARDAGIGKSLVGSQPGSDGALSVSFRQVPFDTLVAWLSQLGDRYGVSAVGATVDEAGSAGVVNATLVLRSR